MLRIHDIVDTPGLGVVLAAGADGLQNRVRWVHVSELRDPTPWLEGGELLLTTGLGSASRRLGKWRTCGASHRPGWQGWFRRRPGLRLRPERARPGGRPSRLPGAGHPLRAALHRADQDRLLAPRERPAGVDDGCAGRTRTARANR